MKYYASDIIKKARIAADLVNSDFIDWYEEVSLLNDTYQSLYQNLIEINDPSFVKIIETTDKVIQLPEDFHQLRCVTLLRNGFSTPILRRSFSESYNSMSYEILGSELHINTPYVQSPPDGVYHIEYFSSPVTLLFRPEKEKTNFGMEDNVPGDAIVMNATKDHVAYIYDDDHSYLDERKLPNSFGVDDLVYFTSKYLIHIIRETNGNYFIYDADTGTLLKRGTQTSTSMLVIYDDGSVGTYYKQNKKLYYGIGDSEVCINEGTITVPDGGNRPYIIFVNSDLSDYWFVDTTYDSSFGEVFHFSENIYLSENEMLKGTGNIYYKNGTLYCRKNDSVIIVNNDNTYKVDNVKNLVGLGLFDENTGLSYITETKDYECYVNPFVTDTLLDYPNSFFFQVMVYALAVQYKIKQGADATGLQAIYNGYYDNFMKSLPQDVYMPSRVNNVYTY